MVFPEGEFGNYSNRNFFLSDGIVACENTVNSGMSAARLDVPRLEAGTIMTAADIGAERITRYAWGALGSAVWPRSYGYTPTADAWQATGSGSMRNTILARVSELAEVYKGDRQLQNDYHTAKNILLDPDATPYDFVTLVQRSTPVPLSAVHEVCSSWRGHSLRGDPQGNVPFGIAIAADLPTGFDVELDMGNMAQIAHVLRKAGIERTAARHIMLSCDGVRARRLNWQDPVVNTMQQHQAPRHLSL